LGGMDKMFGEEGGGVNMREVQICTKKL